MSGDYGDRAVVTGCQGVAREKDSAYRKIKRLGGPMSLCRI